MHICTPGQGYLTYQHWWLQQSKCWQRFHNTLCPLQALSVVMLSWLKPCCTLKSNCNIRRSELVMTNFTAGGIANFLRLISTTLPKTSRWVATAVILFLRSCTLIYERCGKSKVLTLPHVHDATGTYGTPLYSFYIEGLIPRIITKLLHVSNVERT